jgi:hypothetical protein
MTSTRLTIYSPDFSKSSKHKSMKKLLETWWPWLFEVDEKLEIRRAAKIQEKSKTGIDISVSSVAPTV